MSELRFSLNERKPDGIKSTGNSGNVVSLQDSGVKALLEEIHNTKPEDHNSTRDWVLLTYASSDLKELKLLGSGNGGIEELKNAGLTDNIVAYGLIRIVDVVDNIPTTRFVYLTWIGQKVSGITNARIGVNKTAVTGIIGHYSIEYLASTLEEISESEIVGRVQDASGSRVRVLDTKKKQNNTTSKPSGVFSIVPKEQGGLKVLDDDLAKDLIKKIRHKEDGLNWICLSYASREELSVSGSGSGGLDELRQHLKDNQVSYGFFSTESTIDSTEMRRFIYLRWVPENVSPLLKGKLTTHRGFCEDYFRPFHININATDLNEITNDIVNEKISHMTGK